MLRMSPRFLRSVRSFDAYLESERGKEGEVDEDDDEVCESSDDASYIECVTRSYQGLVTFGKVACWVSESVKFGSARVRTRVSGGASTSFEFLKLARFVLNSTSKLNDLEPS
jgi:hypothetical protein